MNSRKFPENALSPEFIKVAYDKHGNPLSVSPVDLHAPKETNGEKIKETFSPKPIPQPIEEWLVLISKNIISLKRDLQNTQNVYNQIIQEVKQITIPVIDLTPIDNSINATNYRIDAVLQKLDATNQQVNDQKMMYQLLADQINVMNEIVASVAKEFSYQQTISRELAEKIEMLNEQLNGSFVSIQQILKDMELMNSDKSQLSDIDERISVMHRQLASSIERTEGNIVALNGILAEMKGKIDSLETSNFEIQVAVQNSLKELADNFEKMNSETKNQIEYSIKAFSDSFSEINSGNKIDMENSLKYMKQELMATIEQNKIDREALIQEIVDRTSKRMRRLVKTPKVEVKIKVKKKRTAKRKHRKIKKIKVKKIAKRKTGKINKTILAKKLMKADMQTYPSALIVTERRMQRVGRAVFDVAKNMNKNVLMIMQNKMSESDGFEPITYDAMSNSDAIFLVTKKNMKKNFSLKTLVATKPIFFVNQQMKFSEMKN
jgi:hypothetical protein